MRVGVDGRKIPQAVERGPLKSFDQPIIPLDGPTLMQGDQRRFRRRSVREIGECDLGGVGAGQHERLAHEVLGYCRNYPRHAVHPESV